MKTYWGVEVQLHVLLTTAPEGAEWSDSRPGRSASGKEHPLYIWWKAGGVSVGLDAEVKRKSLCPSRESNFGRPARNLIAILTELYRLLPRSLPTEILLSLLVLSFSIELWDAWRKGCSEPTFAHFPDVGSSLPYTWWVS